MRGRSQEGKIPKYHSRLRSAARRRMYDSRVCVGACGWKTIGGAIPSNSCIGISHARRRWYLFVSPQSHAYGDSAQYGAPSLFLAYGACAENPLLLPGHDGAKPVANVRPRFAITGAARRKRV